jgi:hypothetical protein
MRSSLLFACIAPLAACATSASTLQRAQTLKKGHVEVQGAMGLPISSKLIGDVTESARNLKDRIQERDQAGEALSKASRQTR